MGRDERRSSWLAELDDLMRGMAGAFLFGAPFLYTMEVWWKGNITSPPRMLVTLAFAYVSLVVLNLSGGFRARREQHLICVLADSVEALAIALLAAVLGLVLIGVLRPEEGLQALVGRVVMEAVPFSIGVGIANHFLKKADEDNSDQGDDPKEHQWHDHAWKGTLADAGATILGATVIASSIAPTDEIPMIASGLTSPWLLAMVFASVLLSYMIVFEANFGSQSARRTQPGIFQSPISETVVSYLLSLLVAMMMLNLFQLIGSEDPWSQWISYTVVLGLPATVGGAAGRLAL